MNADRVKAQAAEPLRTREQIEALKRYLTEHERRGKMYALMVTCGCNLGLRAGDLGRLTAGDMKGTHLRIAEEKTWKRRQIFINDQVRRDLDSYLSRWIVVGDGMMLFAAQGKAVKIDVKHIHKVIKRSCRALGFEGNYGSHTLRKTFAHFLFEQIPHTEVVRRVFGHSNINVTSAYLDEADRVRNAQNDRLLPDACEGCGKTICKDCTYIDSAISRLNL